MQPPSADWHQVRHGHFTDVQFHVSAEQHVNGFAGQASDVAERRQIGRSVR